MKQIFLIAQLAFLTMCTYAQDTPPGLVPSLVLNSFQQKFPKATDVDWEQLGPQYEVEFDIGFKDHDVWFDSTGKIVRHIEEISYNELPKAIISTLNRDFSGYRTTDIDKVDDNGIVTYKIELENFSAEWNVLFNTEGKILDKVAD